MVVGSVGGWRAPFGGSILIQMRGHRRPRVRGDGCHEADIEPAVEHAGERVRGIGRIGWVVGGREDRACAAGLSDGTGTRASD